MAEEPITGDFIRKRFALRLMVAEKDARLGDPGLRTDGVRSCAALVEQAAVALDRERVLHKEADEGLELAWTELNQATEDLDRERARHAADAEALRVVIQHLRPGAAIVRVDEPTTGRHRYELWTNLTAQPAAHAEFVSKVYGVPWTDEPKRNRDADLPATGSFHA